MNGARIFQFLAIGLFYGALTVGLVRGQESNLTDVGDRVRRAFEASHDGWSLDEVLLSDERRRRVIEAVRQTMPDAEEKLVWEWLIGLRKAGKLDVATTRRVYHDLDAYLPLAEIVARRMQDELQLTFDQILIDPVRLKEFDEKILEMDPAADVYYFRKSVLRLRKTRRLEPELVLRVTDWRREILTLSLAEARHQLDKLPARPGVYIFRDATGYLYIGQSSNLKHRISAHLDHSDRFHLAHYLADHPEKQLILELHVFAPGSPAEATLVREAYESELIRSRQPRLNLAP